MMKNKFYKKTNLVKEYIKTHLSKDRYEHSIRVANCARKLAKIYKKTKKTARLSFFAGLSHDICKELSNEKQLEILKKTGEKITFVEKQRINLVHGSTAAYILKTEFNVHNREILNAVKFHTFASPKMKTVAKLIFVADKIEPEREGIEYLQNLVGKVSLNRLTLEVLRFCMDSTIKKGLKLSPKSIKAEKFLVRKLKL